MKRLVYLLGLLGSLLIAVPALAAPHMVADITTTQAVHDAACKLNPSALGCAAGFNPFGPHGLFNNGIAVVIGLVAAVAVIMVVIGGLRYVLSGGDSAGIKSAKDTILYALIGLGVAMVAFVIVGFVIGRLG